VVPGEENPPAAASAAASAAAGGRGLLPGLGESGGVHLGLGMVVEERREEERREELRILARKTRNLFFSLNLFLPPLSLPTQKQPASFQRLLGTASSASIMADKQRHSRQRRQQAKAFSPVALSSYAPRVAAATERAVALWAAASGEEEAIDLGLALSDLTWAYALATVVDVSLDAEESRKVRTAWEDFTKNLFSAPLDFPGSRFRTALRARETLSKAMGRAVREYKASFEEENGKEKEGKEGKEEGDGKNSSSDLPTMMSIYMRARADDGDPLGEEELVDMSIGLLLAG